MKVQGGHSYFIHRHNLKLDTLRLGVEDLQV